MKVGEVRDPQPVELPGKAPDPNRLDLEPDPAGLEPPPCRSRGSGAEKRKRRDRNQASSFSSTGVTGTT